jgi:hypothetical protein
MMRSNAISISTLPPGRSAVCGQAAPGDDRSIESDRNPALAGVDRLFLQQSGKRCDAEQLVLAVARFLLCAPTGRAAKRMTEGALWSRAQRPLFCLVRRKQRRLMLHGRGYLVGDVM